MVVWFIVVVEVLKFVWVLEWISFVVNRWFLLVGSNFIECCFVVFMVIVEDVDIGSGGIFIKFLVY